MNSIIITSRLLIRFVMLIVAHRILATQHKNFSNLRRKNVLPWDIITHEICGTLF